MASPVERIADSLDEHATEEEKGGGKLESAVRGEFGEYEFDEAQLKAGLLPTPAAVVPPWLWLS